MLLFHYTTENKTLTQTPNGESPKTTFRKGAESGFCLWQQLGNLNQKIAHSGEDLDFFSEMVQGEGFEPPKAEPTDLQSVVFDRFTIPALRITGVDYTNLA